MNKLLLRLNKLAANNVLEESLLQYVKKCVANRESYHFEIYEDVGIINLLPDKHFKVHLGKLKVSGTRRYSCDPWEDHVVEIISDKWYKLNKCLTGITVAFIKELSDIMVSYSHERTAEKEYYEVKKLLGME